MIKRAEFMKNGWDYTVIYLFWIFPIYIYKR